MSKIGSDGAFTLKVPRSLHRRLAMAAKRDGVSLNDYCAASIAEYVGAREAVDQAESTVPPGLDPGINLAVEILMAAGIETFESCEGGAGHSYPEPTVRFHGERAEGFRALSVAMHDGRLKVAQLRRVWPINDGEPTGPWWEIVFAEKAK